MMVIRAIAGAYTRLLFGGAPHTPDPDRPGQQLRGWLGKGPCYAIFVLLTLTAIVTLPTDAPNFAAMMIAIAGEPRPYVGYLIVAVVSAAGWNAGHGSYLNPGTRTHLDNEEVRGIVRFVARLLGIEEMRDGRATVAYDILGMSIRYGIPTLATGLVMFICQRVLGSELPGWWLYAPIGFLAGPIMYGLHLARWSEGVFVIKPWLDPYFHNGPFEIAIGALIVGAAPLAKVTV